MLSPLNINLLYIKFSNFILKLHVHAPGAVFIKYKDLLHFHFVVTLYPPKDLTPDQGFVNFTI